MNKINEATFFLFKSEKKTGEEHLKQMREGLRNNLLFFLFVLRKYLQFYAQDFCLSKPVSI